MRSKVNVTEGGKVKDQCPVILTIQAWKQIHCHLAIRYCTIRQTLGECLIVNICFNVLNYVFILFVFNLYCLVNIQQHCHNSSHCD